MATGDENPFPLSLRVSWAYLKTNRQRIIMGIANLHKLFAPESIAVVGASERPGSIGAALINNLLEGGFTGRLLPVNPKYTMVSGLEAVDSISKAVRIDLAVIAVPIKQVPEILQECAQAGIQAAIIISAGGKETGIQGLLLEQEIRNAASRGNIRILGPNCLGLMVPAARLNASFSAGMPGNGNIAFVSQSGGVCAAILDHSFKEKIGFSHFVSIGSMLDVDFGDVIDYLGHDSKTRSILLYIEHLSNIRKFISAARAVSPIKPILALKVGRSPAGILAAGSHCGALAAEDSAYDAAFKRAGIIRVGNTEELFDIAELLSKQSRPAGPRMAVITNTGGPGVMAIDAMEDLGVIPASLSSATISGLEKILPPYWNQRNPVDIFGDASTELYARAMKIIAENEPLHALTVILAPQALTSPMAVAEILVDTFRGNRLPVFAVWMGGRDVEAAVAFLNQSGIATYTTPERAVQAFAYMVQYSRNLEMIKQIPPRVTQHLSFDRQKVQDIVESAGLTSMNFLSEHHSKEILSAYGITVNPSLTADSADTAVDAAERIGWPVALKVLSEDITHKSDADGVQLDLRTPAEVITAYERILTGARDYDTKAHINGVTVQSYIPHPDYELLMGVKRDEIFGPLLLFGMGGVFTEIIHDRAVGLPPLNQLLARRLIEGTRVFKLLQGYRNRKPADIDALVTMLIQLSQLVVDIPEIAELDINPVIVKNGSPVVVDARLLLHRNTKPSPLHLVISPYPSHYEIDTVARNGLPLKIRPIKPEDAELFIEFFGRLSPSSVYFRFFQHVKELSPATVAMLTQTDYDRHVALVVLERSSNHEKMLGVARIIADPDITHCEFSVMVEDQWHGQGIGAMLLYYLLKVAKKQGVESLWGLVLPENTSMLRLGKKIGFEARFDREEGAYYLKIDLKEIKLETEAEYTGSCSSVQFE